MMDEKLERFYDAQKQDYACALAEIQNGYKKSHWMWYIFPQLKGLGKSPTAQYYSIEDLELPQFVRTAQKSAPM